MFALKRDFPHLSFSLNGGVQSCESGAAALQLAPLEGAALSGVMIGRAAYNAPWACLADADRAIFSQATNAASSRQQVHPGCSSCAVQRDVLLGCTGHVNIKPCCSKLDINCCSVTSDMQLALAGLMPGVTTGILAQVLEAYGRYADAAVGKFGTLPKGGPAPGVRQVLKPLLALFHGEQGCKRWKQAIDKHARSGATASAAIQVQHRLSCCSACMANADGLQTPQDINVCMHGSFT